MGETPGEKKIKKAEQQNVEILRLEDYEKLDTFIKKPKERKKKQSVQSANIKEESKPQVQTINTHNSSVEITSQFETELLGDVRREAMANLEVINNSPDKTIQSKRMQKEKIKPIFKKTWIYLSLIFFGVFIAVF